MKSSNLFLSGLFAMFILTNTVLAQSPVMVKDLNSGAGNGNPVNLTNVNGRLFFRGNDGSNGNELWKSDGTTAGTMLLKNINPTSNGSGSGQYCDVNGTLFFAANDGTNGAELWKSDGTSAGTVIVKDLTPGSGNSDLTFFSNVNGMLVFKFDDGVHGTELWKSDGTAAGTTMLKDINEGSADGIRWSTRLEFEMMNGVLYFQGKDAVNEDELLKTDGTTAGTVMVKDIAVGNGSGPTQFTNGNGTLFFTAKDASGPAIWKSDGTDAGTVKVSNTSFTTGGATGLTFVNGTLFFSDGEPFDTGIELWKSDGTATGTVLVKDIKPGTGNSLPGLLTNVNGTLFFRADDGVTSAELWKSDGTAAGTVLVKDVSPGTGGGLTFAEELVVVNGVVFFIGIDANGLEVWKSDGTETGTTGYNLFAGGQSSLPSVLTAVGNNLYFSANNGGGAGIELWSIQNVATGNESFVKSGPFTLFPNPATEQVILETSDFRNTEVGIFNSKGQCVQTISLTGIRTPVNTARFSPGVYMMKLRNSVSMVRFVKQ